MSAWRRQALERLPECRHIAENAANPMALWIELSWACQNVYRNGNDDLIRRFFDFARECWNSPNAELRTAVAVAFYEHLPSHAEIRQDLPRRVSRAEFTELRETFRYHLSPAEADAFEREFLEARQKIDRDILKTFGRR